MTFDDWWKRVYPGYKLKTTRGAGAKAAWSHQQARIDELEERLVADQTQGQTYRTLLLIALREYVEIPEDILYNDNADEEAIAWFSQDTTTE